MVSAIEKSVGQVTSELHLTAKSGLRSIRTMIRGSRIETIVNRVIQFVNDNRRLIFWFSTSTLLAAALPIFLLGTVVGVGFAMNNYFGLREHRIEHLSWETAEGAMSGIAFVCGLLFHYHIQCAWGGIAFGSHLYRLWTGQVDGNPRSRWQAIDYEAHLFTRECARWVHKVLPPSQKEDKVADRFIPLIAT